MSEEVKKWIVLINRAPKGPLVLEEVRALIDEGIIRRNDLACLIHEDKSQKSDWKFLWQFVEFDRRTEASTDSVSAEEIAKRERRSVLEEEELKHKAKALLPEEIESIRTEDLIIHSTAISSKNTAEEPDLSEEEVLPAPVPRSHAKLIFGAISSMALFVIFVIQGRNGGKESKKAPEMAIKNIQIPLEETEPSSRTPASSAPKAPISGGQTKPRKMEPPPQLPEARDQGDIAYEEYRKKRDAEIEKEKLKEEEERSVDSKAEEEAKSEEEPSKNSKKKKLKEEEESSPAESDSSQESPPAETAEEPSSAEESN